MNTYELRTVSLAELFSLGGKVEALLWEQGGACLSSRAHLWAQMADGQWGGWSSACQLCAALGDMLGLHPRKGSQPARSPCITILIYILGVLGTAGGWYCALSGKIHLCSLVKTWPDVSARELVENKALLDSGIACLGVLLSLLW